MSLLENLGRGALLGGCVGFGCALGSMTCKDVSLPNTKNYFVAMSLLFATGVVAIAAIGGSAMKIGEVCYRKIKASQTAQNLAPFVGVALVSSIATSPY